LNQIGFLTNIKKLKIKNNLQTEDADLVIDFPTGERKTGFGDFLGLLNSPGIVCPCLRASGL
jgi:hypothetical protein